MFPRLFLNPTVGRRIGGLMLVISVAGVGLSQVPDRRPTQVERPPVTPRPMPSMERPPARVMPERPVRSTEGRPFARPALREAPIRPTTSAIVAPRPMLRCAVMPTPGYWKQRDIMAEIQAMARRGFIAVHPVGEGTAEFTGVSDYPAGWTAYGFRVPPGENIHVRLTHSNEGWFRLAMVNKWGSLEPGMLQNLIPTGNPEVTYNNPTKETRSVYVIVDDPGWMSSQANPFSVKVSRSWNPELKKVDDAPIVTGIWAQKKDQEKPSVPAKETPVSVESKG